MEECEGRLEKGAEYVDVLQAQIDEMTEEISNMKRAEEVCNLSVLFVLSLSRFALSFLDSYVELFITLFF